MRCFIAITSRVSHTTQLSGHYNCDYSVLAVGVCAYTKTGLLKGGLNRNLGTHKPLVGFIENCEGRKGVVVAVAQFSVSKLSRCIYLMRARSASYLAMFY